MFMCCASITRQSSDDLLFILLLQSVKSVLGRKHVVPLLVELSRGSKMMTELSSIVSNYSGLQLILRDLADEGYVKVRETFEDKRKIIVSLTDKGRIIAEQLKKAEEVAGYDVRIPDSSVIQVPPEFIDQWESLRLIHVNTYEDHVTLKEVSAGKERIFNIYIRENGHGSMRLWCELDESFNCVHIGYSMTIPAVQDMFARMRGGK